MLHVKRPWVSVRDNTIAYNSIDNNTQTITIMSGVSELVIVDWVTISSNETALSGRMSTTAGSTNRIKVVAGLRRATGGEIINVNMTTSNAPFCRSSMGRMLRSSVRPRLTSMATK